MSGICIAVLGSVQADKNMADGFVLNGLLAGLDVAAICTEYRMVFFVLMGNGFQRNDVMKHITIRRIILNSINVHKSKKSKKYQPAMRGCTREYVRKCGKQ